MATESVLDIISPNIHLESFELSEELVHFIRILLKLKIIRDRNSLNLIINKLKSLNIDPKATILEILKLLGLNKNNIDTLFDNSMISDRKDILLVDLNNLPHESINDIEQYSLAKSQILSCAIIIHNLVIADMTKEYGADIDIIPIYESDYYKFVSILIRNDEDAIIEVKKIFTTLSDDNIKTCLNHVSKIKALFSLTILQRELADGLSFIHKFPIFRMSNAHTFYQLDSIEINSHYIHSRRMYKGEYAGSKTESPIILFDGITLFPATECPYFGSSAEQTIIHEQ